MSLSNYDYSKYPTWEQVKTPSGATYYVVPGTAFVYDPFLSQQKGKPVLWQNPKPQQDERAKAEKAAKDAASPLNQLLPVAGSTAGVVGANYLINALNPATSAATTAATTGGAQVAGQVAAQQAAQQAAAQGVGQTASLAAPEIVGAGRVAGQGAAEAGGGMLGEAGNYVAPALAAAIAAKGTYDAYKGWEHGGEGMRSGLTTAGAGIGSLMFGPGLGTAAGAAFGNVLGYGLQGDSWKNKAALLATSPILLGAKLAGVDLMHKTTKQVQQERWGKLADNKIAGIDAAYAANHPQGDTGVWDTGKYAGQKWTFEKASELAKEDPSSFRSVYGNYATFGNDWNTYSDKQRDAITAGLLDANLYKSEKGDIIVTDEDKAHEIKNQVLGIAKPTTATDAFAQGVGAKNLIGKIDKPIVVNAEPPRSSTSSPGISKDGKVMSSKEIGKLLAKRMNKN